MTPDMHPKEVLYQEIARVDSSLERRVVVYLIGGGSMSFQGLKDATKDIDGILESEAELQLLAAALEEAGYTAPKELDPEYMDLSATQIYEKEHAPQWDLFIRVVCKKLRLSPGMKARSTLFAGSGQNLQLRLIAPEDIFVFKSITERQGDIPDVDVLWASGLDWDAVLDEMRWQSHHSDQAWAGFFLETLHRLQGEGRHVPILKAIADLAEMEIDEWVVITALQEPRSRKELIAYLQAVEDAEVGPAIEAAVDRLIERGRIMEGELLRLNAAYNPHSN